MSDAARGGKDGSEFFGSSGDKPDAYVRAYAQRSGIDVTKAVADDGLPWSSLRSPRSSARCLFVYPGITSPGWGCNRKGQTSNEAVYMSHGMAYVSAALKARGHLAWLLDMRTCRGWPDFARRVREAEYDVAFLGFLSLDVFSAACAVRVLKEEHPDRPVVVGGLHVSCNEDKVFPPDDLPALWLNRAEETHPLVRQFLDWKGEAEYDASRFPKADCVVWNEAEIVACLLAEDVAAGGSVPKFVNARTVPDLNSAPHCDRDLFDFDLETEAPLLAYLPKPFATVTFGRGCPLKCRFCFDGDSLIDTDEGIKRISDVVDGGAGQRVLMADGRWGGISARMKRPYSGEVITLRAAYLASPLVVTDEHEVWVVQRDGSEGWVKAKDVGLNMFLSVPFVAESVTESIYVPDEVEKSDLKYDVPEVSDGHVSLMRSKFQMPVQFALDDDGLRFLGLYLAEGHAADSRGQKSSVVGFTFADHEHAIGEWVREFASKRYGIDSRVVKKKDACFQVFLQSPVLSAFLRGLFGAGARNKSIPPVLQAMEKSKRLKFLAAYFQGDGTPGSVSAKGIAPARVVTASESLAFQVFRALWSCNVGCALQAQDQPEMILGRKVNVGKLWTVRLLPGGGTEQFARMCFPDGHKLTTKMLHPHRWTPERVLLAVLEVTGEQFDGDVYNLTVEPRHEIVAHGVLVKNCNVGTQLSSANVRTIDPDYFMDELAGIKARYGRLGSLMIHDDILLYPKWLDEWNRKLRDRFGYTPYWCQMRADFICKFPDLMRTMAECGMAWVSIGLESGSQRMLDAMSKQTTVEENLKSCAILRELGVNVFGNWMLGLPGEKEEDMLATAAMMKEIARGGIRHSASVYCNYPGTSMARELRLTDGLEDRWYARSHFPWQRALKGIDYKRVYEIQGDVMANAPDHAERPKFWPASMPLP